MGLSREDVDNRMMERSKKDLAFMKQMAKQTGKAAGA
jgi:hypothetical protein